MSSTQKELKDGLTLNETVSEDGVKFLTFTNSTVDKQFICKYGFKGAEPEALGTTKKEGEKWILSVHPGETLEFVRGKWTGLTKSIATGPCSKEWMDKQAGAAKDSNVKEWEAVVELMDKNNLKNGSAAEVAELCEKKGIPFVDPSFLPLDSSLQTAWQKGDMKLFAFKRPAQWELLKDTDLKPQLFVNKIEPSDVNQGSLADCYLMGALGSVAQYDRLVRFIFSSRQNGDLGVYRVNLCKNAWWKTIVIDDFMPCSGPKPSFARNRDEPNELWVALIEKAYAKANGSYFAMKTGQCAAALADLTGCPYRTVPMADDLWDSMLQNSKDGILQVFGTPGRNLMYVDEATASKEDKELWDKYRAVELICEHSYSVLKCVTTKAGQRFIKVRNPWGNTVHGLWKGKWALDDPDWTPSLKKEVGWDETDGVFWMSWEECEKWFASVSIGYTLPDWESIRVAGQWTKGVPSVCIELDVKEKTQMWVGLHQSDTRGIKPGSCADASYISMNLFVVAPKREGVKVVESFGTAKRDRFGLLELDPSQGKLFILGVPKEGTVTKDFVLSLLVEKVESVDVFFNKPSGAVHYATGKEVVLSQWVSGEQEYQIFGPKLSPNGVTTKKGAQMGSAPPATREVAPKAKKEKESASPKAAKVAHSDPTVAVASPKAKVRSGSGGLPGSPPAGNGAAKSALRSKTVASPTKKETPVSLSPKAAEPKAEEPKAKPSKPLSGDVNVEVQVLSASGLVSKGSQNPFCEVKLRKVQNGVVSSDHPNPQKQTTKVVNKNLSPTWGDKFQFKVPVADCIRISIFGKKMMGKDYLGRVDLMASDLAGTLNEGELTKKTYKITGEDEGRGPVSGSLELALRLT